MLEVVRSIVRTWGGQARTAIENRRDRGSALLPHRPGVHLARHRRVSQQHSAAVARLRVQQFHARWGGPVGEDLTALAEHNGVYPQLQLVAELLGEQRLLAILLAFRRTILL